MRWASITSRSSDDHRGERGSQLVELVLTVALLGLVLGTVYAGISSLTNAAEGTSIRLQNLEEARLIMASTTKDIRTATSPGAADAAFVTATPMELEFYANINNPDAAASIVHLRVNAATKLVEEVTPATDETGSSPCTQQPCSYLESAMTTRFVGRYVVNSVSSGRPLFTYYDVAGVEVPTDPVTGVATDDLLRIRAVTVSLAVSKTPAYNVATTTLENRVGLPNIAFQQATGGD